VVPISTSPTFYGLQSAVPFQSVRISMTPATGGGGFSPYIDDFRFEANAIPEPASFGLLLPVLAAGALLFMRRRKP
jgi:hypothetical protein